MAIAIVGDIWVGAYYETPNGIAYVYGCGPEGVTYRCDDDEDRPNVSIEEVVSTWKIRRDLKDFPNARDPRLPYVFDLFWDIKYTSELKAIISGKWDHDERDEIIEQAKELGMV